MHRYLTHICTWENPDIISSNRWNGLTEAEPDNWKISVIAIAPNIWDFQFFSFFFWFWK